MRLYLKILAKFKKVNLYQLFTFFIIAFLVGLFFYKTQPLPIRSLPKPSLSDLQGKETKNQKIKVKNFSLFIPSLNISAPVIPNVSGVKKEYLKALENGLVHFKSTLLPGQGGNIVIFGHSSYYQDRPGNYKDIFKDLEKIKKGDIIKITLNSKKYLYKVSATYVVDPGEVKYLNPSKEEKLTLITCIPPGTTRYRLIVIATPK